jgi:hypothetical protein
MRPHRKLRLGAANSLYGLIPPNVRRCLDYDHDGTLGMRTSTDYR